MLVVCVLLTALFAGQLRSLLVSASFEKALPQSHPYIRNYLDNRSQLRGLGDSVHIVVENPQGDIFDRPYLAVVQAINDEIFLLPGVDRAWMKSVWTPVVRWTEVTEDGFVGGPVMPQDYDGSRASIEALRLNIARAGVVGSLVANDYRSIAVVVPLLAKDGEGRLLDYHRFASSLEAIRQKYEQSVSDAGAAPVRVHIIGFAKLMGDLIEGVRKIMAFFAVAAAIVAAILLGYTRCWRSTALVLSCSLIAVAWQLGLVAMLGYELNPFSVLVPFLVFAIGVSHGAQKMNGIMQDTRRGASRLVAARCTFRRLFMAGLTALLADAFGFAVLTVIDIPVIRELALSASLGVAVLIFTNLVLLPVLLSYVGVSTEAGSRREQAIGHGTGRLPAALDKLTERRWATAALVIAAALGVAAFLVSLQLQVGDLDPGSPELRADSRYNQDNAYVAAHYGISSDVFAVIVRTPKDQCGTYENLIEADRLAWTLAQLPGVQKVESLADTIRAYTAGSFDGTPKWLTVAGDQRIIDSQVSNAVSWNSELLTPECSVIPVVAYLADHKAETLTGVVTTANRFAAGHGTTDRRFLLAAGTSGIEAATNIVVEQSNARMLMCVYAAVIVLCFIAFGSWRAVVVAVLPLLLTSVMAEALMVCLGIGLKVATLPVVALGVGIGVDYALYLVSVQLAHQRAGASLPDAWRHAVSFVGKVVALVGITLAAGVVTWAWSPIKFQADMGILLTFMFVWNMLAALTLVPALSHFLLRDIGKATTRP
ncbi:MMPL family transporter [Piscinibacter sp. XHJ-5]|uniref:efflux RND transporter permease subunit n=1 Tax=Piscinibacter sp. XHJ-5 TaxID=3037797 RepID=UPI003298A225